MQWSFNVGQFAALPLSYALGQLGAQQQYQTSMNYLRWQQYYAQQNAMQQQRWASSEAQKARDFDAQQAQLAREWSSLPSQMQRAKEAGLNPLSVLGSAAPTPASPSSPMPSGGMASPSGAGMVTPNSFVNLDLMGKFIQSIATAGKLSKETSRYDEVTDVAVSKMLQEISNYTEQEFAQRLQNAITMAFGHSKAAAEVSEKFSNAFKLANEGDEAASKKSLNDALAAFQRTKNKEVELLLPFVEKEAEAKIKLLGEQSKTEQSKQREADTAAGLNVQKTQTEREATRLTKNEADIKQRLNALDKDTFDKRKQEALAVLDKQIAEAKSKETAARLKEFRQSLVELAYHKDSRIAESIIRILATGEHIGSVVGDAILGALLK